MQNQALVVVLTLIMNTLNAVVAFALFKPGSVGFIICSIAGFAVSNTLALFGHPVTSKAVAETTKTIAGASLRLLPLAFVAFALNGCATFKNLVTDEASKCGPGLVSAVLQSEAVLQKATSAGAALSDIQDILSAAGADVSSVWCVVQVAIDDLKTKPEANQPVVASNVKGKLATQLTMYPVDPVQHGILVGQDVLKLKP